MSTLEGASTPSRVATRLWAMDSLLERGAELEGLAAQLAAARAAGGSVALLEAPAGQGKTALLRVLRTRARRAGCGC